jgi:NAD(P)-dependent dehydrogenase (short-subunit alcohol dehydrogenase family)
LELVQQVIAHPAERFFIDAELRRFGAPEDIGNAAIYLSCPLGGYVTGTILDVEGGFQLGDASADCLTPTR